MQSENEEEERKGEGKYGPGFTHEEINEIGAGLVPGFAGTHAKNEIQDTEYQVINTKTDH